MSDVSQCDRTDTKGGTRNVKDKGDDLYEKDVHTRNT